MNHIFVNQYIQPKGASVVYWIHAPEHKDMFSEGYIGITKNYVTGRWREHLRRLPKGKNAYKVYDTLRQQSLLVFEIVLVADTRHYCEVIESQLRPTHGIGWNIVKGGKDEFAKVGGQVMKEKWDSIFSPCDRWYKAEMLMLKRIKRKERDAAKVLANKEFKETRYHTPRKLRKDSALGLTGVSYYKKYGNFRSQICIDGTIMTLGYYKTKEEAYEKYIKAKSLVKSYREINADASWMRKQVNS